jgi:hypothetical protein
LDGVVRGNADEALIEGAMVDRAKAETVPHRRLAAGLPIANYVSGV